MRCGVSLLLAGLVVGAGAGALRAAPPASSNFNVNDQGWSVVTVDTGTSGFPTATTGGATYNATGGNPGGFISILDPDSFDTFFRAPAAYQGNLLAALNGTLQFDTITDQIADYNGADVVIKGNGTVLIYDIAPLATANWSTVALTIAPGANWHLNTLGGPTATLSDFQNALANVSEFWITAEYHNGVSETTGLDNVSLNAPSVAPEPSSAALTLLGLAAGLGLCGRRRRLPAHQ